MEQKSNRKGITLISLAITIIVLVILASVATYSGISIVKSSKFAAFSTELKIMQTQINEIYEEKQEDDIGLPIEGDSKTQADKIFTANESGITNQEGYTYWSQEIIKELGIEKIEQDFFVNLKKRSIVSYQGFEYEGKTYYTLEQIPNGLYNVPYENPNQGKPNFEVTRTKVGDNKWSVGISNITYEEGYIDKWELKYKIIGADNWSTTEDLNFVTSTPANYVIKIVNGEIESEEKTISLTYVNPPQLVTGMKKIMFTEPTETKKGETIKDGDSTFKKFDWYEYTDKKWANVETQDGSMWVWIPRFAYKIDSANQKTEVRFLVGTTDKYYDEKGELQTAKRAKSATEKIDATKEYIVHPAFTNETSIGYANGGWDKELTGIWVAKFEAGYASGNNGAPVKASSFNYTQTTSWVSAIETGSSNATMPARNWLDGEYAIKNANGTYSWKNGNPTAIKYPTFQGKTYSMNYINHNDAFNIAKVLNESGNIYGFSTDTDSHLMKNSEWGAVAYLGQSQYGLNGTNIYINNVTLNNSQRSVYAVTGCSSATSADEEEVTTTVENINKEKPSNLYTWNQKEGQKASTTGTIYGIYDISGGLWERTAAYVANGNGNLKGYGESIAYNGTTLKTTSTKYTTIYPHDTTTDNTSISNTTDNLNIACQNNHAKNQFIFGDAIRETSMSGTSSSSWYGDYSYSSGLHFPFSARGGSLMGTNSSGIFAFLRSNGPGDYINGFRAVLVAA